MRDEEVLELSKEVADYLIKKIKILGEDLRISTVALNDAMENQGKLLQQKKELIKELDNLIVEWQNEVAFGYPTQLRYMQRLNLALLDFLKDPRN